MGLGVPGAIDTPQHYIPLGGSSSKLNLSYIYKELGISTNSSAPGSYTGVGSSSGAGMHSIPYSVLFSLLIALVIAIILYIMATRYEGGEGIIKAGGMYGLTYSISPPYSYSGRKLVLRKLFDHIRGRLAGSPLFFDGMTVTEAALLDPSGVLRRFAEIYNSSVFSPNEPSERDVEEAERIVGAWEGNATSAGGS